MAKINWRLIVAITVFFLIWYTWPTEGQEKEGWVISIEVNPKVVVSVKKTTFHIIWRIAKHPDNRQWSLAYGCESWESSGSWGQMDGDSPITYDIYRDVNVGGGCTFEACVYRTVGKPYRCARQHIEGK